MNLQQGVNKQISVFISYRWDDFPDFAKALYDEIKKDNQRYKPILDEKDFYSNGTVSENVYDYITKSDCLISLITESSLNRLENYHQRQYQYDNDSKGFDYVYFELSLAVRNGLAIIPVVLYKSDEEKDAMKNRLDSIFRDWCKEDGYNYLFFDINKNKELSVNLCNKIRGSLHSKKSLPQFKSFEHYYWVGTRKSDIPTYNSGIPEWTKRSFSGSISLFGDEPDEFNLVMCSSDGDKRVDHNDPTDIEQDEFIVNSIGKIIELDKEAKFLFYNPSNVHRLGLKDKFGDDRFPRINDKRILDILNNKMSFRQKMIEEKDNYEVSFFPVLECSRYECEYENLLKAFREGAFSGENSPNVLEEEPSFIIQAPVASGGDGTFILNRENEKIVLSALSRNARYLVSVYYKNSIPINCHAIIYKDDIISTPCSVQLIRPVESENKLLYKGADFVTCSKIGLKYVGYLDEFKRQVKEVARMLQKEGYRGVCGIDAIICDDKVYLMEVNGRFQASTELINRALLSSARKTIQEMHYDSFSENCADSDCEVNVPYSNYSYSYEGASFHDSHIFNIARNSEYIVDIQSDGYSGRYNKKTAEAYLFRLVFRGSISSINEDHSVWINENLVTPDKWLTDKIRSRERLALKLALLIQGITVDKDIDEQLREATNNAVDLQIEDMVINAPTNIKLVEFTPFSLKNSPKYKGKCRLYYYGELLLDNVGVFPKDALQNVQLKSGKHISSVAYLSTDRLRVHTTNKCIYKCQNKSKNHPDGDSCKFCNIMPIENETETSLEELRETVEKYIAALMEQRKQSEGLADKDKPVMLRHFLIGGQSLADSENKLIEFAKELGKYNKPIYAMTLPLSEETVREMISAGVYEFAFNIEIFDEKCREKYMPGKGKIPVTTYFERLIKTRKMLSAYAPPFADKVVRSMVLVGLEPQRSMMEGIKKLIENDIEPMLSVFRPLPGTALYEYNAPPIREVYELFKTVSRMLYDSSANKAGEFRKLGPKCRFCQNNTVSLPWYYQKAEIPKERQYTICEEPFASPNE